MTTVFILLPAYNEESNIRALLEGIEREFKAWHDADAASALTAIPVVVDDGSADRTADECRAYKGSLAVELIQHERNRGLAAALETGLEAILSRCGDDDIIATLDADGTHHPRYIVELCQRIQAGSDIAVASRFAEGGVERGVSPVRKLLSRGARAAYHLFRPDIPLRDFSCGFRAFRAGVIRKTVAEWDERLFETPGFTCTGELMLKALPHTRPGAVVEIPFELQYDRKGGDSKMPAFKTIQGTLTLLWRARSWKRVPKQ